MREPANRHSVLGVNRINEGGVDGVEVGDPLARASAEEAGREGDGFSPEHPDCTVPSNLRRGYTEHGDGGATYKDRVAVRGGG